MSLNISCNNYNKIYHWIVKYLKFIQSLDYFNFFYVGNLSGLHLFDHLLWPIFQSSLYLCSAMIINHETLHSLQCSRALTFVDCFYAAAIQIWINNSLFVKINNSRPCRDLNRDLPVPSQYATNWTILAWIDYFTFIWLPKFEVTAILTILRINLLIVHFA